MPSSRLLLRRALSLAVVAVLVGGALGHPVGVSAEAYDRFYANYAGEELMRATNADRSALGIYQLTADPFLENVARDMATTCPSDASLTIRGRVQDMADRNYFSHDILGCTNSDGTPFRVFNMLARLGYSSSRLGENIAWNRGYGTASTTYLTGCDINLANCHGSIGGVPKTSAVAEQSFMSSSVHRDQLLSTSWDRFGCAGWQSSATGTTYYSCIFASGGNKPLDIAGPAITGLSGSGASFAAGAAPTFTATATDALSVLADGHVSLTDATGSNSHVVGSWAYDHTGTSASLTYTAPALSAGSYRLTWWVRDASTLAAEASVSFSVGSGGGAPTPTPAPSPTPSPTASPTPPPGTTTTLVAACDNISLRATASKTGAVITKVSTGTQVTSVGTVSGASWSVSCPVSAAGSTWYRISAVNGTSVSTLYGVTYLYGATGMFRAVTTPTPTPAATPAPTASPSATPSASPTPAPTPTPGPSPTPTPAPTATPSPTPSPTPATTTMTVVCGPVNVRTGPGTTYSIMTTAAAGTVVTVDATVSGGSYTDTCVTGATSTLWVQISKIGTQVLTMPLYIARAFLQ